MVAKTEQTKETPLDRALALRHKAPPKTFTPVGADVCCYFFEPKEVFADTAIILPDNAKDRFNTTIALVLAVGPGCEYAREGDVILVKGGEFSERLGAPVKYGQSTIGYGGYKYQVFPEYMVAGILYREGSGGPDAPDARDYAGKKLNED